jgi:hypothetical protein
MLLSPGKPKATSRSGPVSPIGEAGPFAYQDRMTIELLHAEPVGAGIVETLEWAMAEAKAGRLSSIAIATVDREGCTDRKWSKPPSAGLLLASVSRLAHKLNREMDGE